MTGGRGGWALDRPGESDARPRAHRALEVSVRSDGDDTRLVSLTEEDERTGVLHVAGGRVVDLRVVRDERANERGLELLRAARTEDRPLVVTPAERGTTPSPDHIDLRDPGDETARRFWDERVAADLAALDMGCQRGSLPEQTSGPPDLDRVDQRWPELYERDDTTSSEPVDALESPRRWAADRNPAGDGDIGRAANCGDCARAAELRWRGVDAVAGSCRSLEGESTDVMDAWSPGDRVPATFDLVAERLRQLGPGASAVVGIDRHEGGGHWFNAVNDQGVIVAVDAQAGVCKPWPPSVEGLGFDESDAAHADAVFIDAHGHHLHTDELETPS